MSARFGGSFPPIRRFEKFEIHTVFLRFSNLDLTKNLSPNLLAKLCGAALTIAGGNCYNYIVFIVCNCAGRNYRQYHAAGDLGQHRAIASLRFAGSFPPILRFEKFEIHTVFLHFPNLDLTKNLSPNLLAELCGAALILNCGCRPHRVNLPSRR